MQYRITLSGYVDCESDTPIVTVNDIMLALWKRGVAAEYIEACQLSVEELSEEQEHTP
jgi:hypothetical protein